MTAQKKNNPIEEANLISRLCYWWTLKLFSKGAKDGITLEDLFTPITSDRSKFLADKLEHAWHNELTKLELTESNQKDKDSTTIKSLKPSLLRAIIRCFGMQIFIFGIFQMFINVILFNLQPIIQNWIIEYFDVNNTSITQNNALGYAGALTTVALLLTFIMHQLNYFSQIIGLRFRVACCSLIYRKSLKLSKPALDKTPPGQIINLLSNDVSRFDLIPMFINFLWITPLQIFVVGYIVWRNIGIYTLVGYGVLCLVTIPMQSYVGKISGKLRKVTAKLTDRRVQLMSELISGIQVVKMYAWEKPFNKIVAMIRLDEIKQITRSNNVRGLYSILSGVSQKIMVFATLVTFIFDGNLLDPKVTFQIAVYFNNLQIHMALCYPMAIILLIQSIVAVKRIEEFLLLEEVKENAKASDIVAQMPEIVESRVENKANPGAVVVKLDKVSANWKFGQLPPTLYDVSLKINGGELCTLVGPVGSGKSSLLNLFLQELPVGAGTVELFQFSDKESAGAKSKSGFSQDNPGMRISYASQDSWLFTGSVRENILFGQEYDKARYQEVAKVCSLLQDFKQLPEGDLTIVGERGASLSGGQRARINLARAIYRPADLYLLDDPLSAVDARVSRRLFQDCILGYLKGKTRILVTHQLNYLMQADTIVEIDRGTIKHHGTFEALAESDSEFINMLNNLNNDKNNTSKETDIVPGADKKSSFIRERRRSSQISIKSQDSHRSMPSEDLIDKDEAGEVPDEVMGTGFISKDVYFRYFREGGGIIGSILLALIFIIAQVSSIGVDQWLTYWTALETYRPCLDATITSCSNVGAGPNSLVNNTIFTPWLGSDGLLPATTAIYIYLALLIIFTVLSVLKCYCLVAIGMRAARKLHNLMFKNILQATMYFFNTNPSGRLLNRFSKDVGAMDELLLPFMLQAFLILFDAAGTIVNIMVVNPWMIILTLIAGIVFYIVTAYYLTTAQDAKRLEGITKSPVYTLVNTTLNGLPTIRSRGKDVETMLRNQFDDFQDHNSGAWYILIGTGSAYGFSIDMITSTFISILSFTLILINPVSTFGASVGLAISQALSLTGLLQYGVKQATEVQSQMTAVERIIQYTDLPKEGPIESSKQLPENWPSKGRLQWKNVYLSYKKDDPAVLKNIDLMIEPGWKVGVVGRTGAGKSSLISALFRLVDDGLQGQIIIDGVDTKTIGLQDLRSNISTIPQEPVLFSETLRYNLDPFGKYTDKEIWDALREVELSDLALDQWVTEGGTNFSVGQRQLICLARALLRNNRILVLDEATANIDSRTDALIQKAIRSKFVDCTVITIAHRLNTIINSDRVLVMDNGCAVEFDAPYELLMNKSNSMFAKMVEQTGPSMAATILHEVIEFHQQSEALLGQVDLNFPDKHNSSSDF
ncbi:GSCOCT00011969001.2-RA-CDS [Cotesia congregata]|uniref:ATP-binding cassette transporter subfamily C member 13 n=1 Tax=Cotesia congregata TaxID=51543 RepID=A0A8J2H8P7_COTCN|nr:GSCOCT00011969001.2-RA-CDS [Cotesia congregata]CAG5084263.1 ATP-binding cassette transporter subfamily C member 13 [Cotesia congregata]